MASDESAGTTGSGVVEPRTTRSAIVKRIAVWFSFALLATIAGLIGYSFWLSHQADSEVPKLESRVRAAFEVAAGEPGFADRMIWANRISSIEGPNPLELAPKVDGAEVHSFSVSLDDVVRFVYVGTDLASERCVAADVTPAGRVFTGRTSCRAI